MTQIIGPWKLIKGGLFPYNILNAHDEPIAWILDREGYETSARLIAAAPELLEILEEITDNQMRFGECPSFVWDKAFDVIRKAKEAE